MPGFSRSEGQCDAALATEDDSQRALFRFVGVNYVSELAISCLNGGTIARNSGTVKNLKDRRHDLYAVNWRGH